MSGTVIIAEWEAAGFDVRNVNHALAVLVRDFPGPLDELGETLRTIRIADTEIVSGGGGESSPTQRLRRTLAANGWRTARLFWKLSGIIRTRSSTAIWKISGGSIVREQSASESSPRGDNLCRTALSLSFAHGRAHAVFQISRIWRASM